MAKTGFGYDIPDLRVVAFGTQALTAGQTVVVAAITRTLGPEVFQPFVWLRPGNGAVAVNAQSVAGDGVAYFLRRTAGGMELVCVCGTQNRQIDFAVMGIS